MTIKEIREMKTENLILYLCTSYHKETKKARDTEQRIIKELAKRNIVDETYMIELFNN
jgi:hypothetical protein